MGINIKQLWQDRADVAIDIQSGKEAMQAMLDNPASRDASNVACFSEEQEDLYSRMEETLKENQAKLLTINTQIVRHEDLQKAEELVAAVRVGRTGDEDDDGPVSLSYARPKALQVFHNFGEQLRAVYDLEMNQENVRGIQYLHQLNAVAIGAGESIGADGGFLVQTDFTSEILRIMHSTGEILGRISNTPVSGNRLLIPTIDETSGATGSRFGAVRGYWVGEGTAPTPSQPKFSSIEWVLKKIVALGYATDEILEDTTAMASIFSEAFGHELRWLAENAIINGSGAGEPLGILNSDALITVSKETGQVAATIVHENISAMWTRMWAPSRMNAVWFYNQDIEPQLDVMSIPAGTAALEPKVVTYNEAGVMRIKGRPAVPIEYAAALGTVGDLILADLSQYRTIDKGGVSQDSSIHVRFLQAETAFRAQYRLDGKPIWKSAFTPANGASKSPCVTLATRS